MKDYITKLQFDRLKIVQFEDIPIVKDMECPNCHKSNDWEISMHEPRPFGWCDTATGLMMIAECPFCREKFRYHINTTGRYDMDEFYEDFALRLHLYEQKYNKYNTKN